MADGKIRVETKLDTSQIKVDLKDMQRMCENTTKKMKSTFDRVSASSLKNEIKSIEQEIKQNEKALESYQKRLNDINSDKEIKEIQKMIDKNQFALDKGKAKIDEYQNKLDKLQMKKDALADEKIQPVLDLAKEGNWSEGHTSKSVNRELESLNDDKAYQKLLSQEESIIEKIDLYKSKIIEADQNIKTMSATMENMKTSIQDGISNAIDELTSRQESLTKIQQILNEEKQKELDLQNAINDVNASLNDDSFLRKIKNAEQYNQILQETKEKIALIEEESARVSSATGVDYDSILAGNEQYSKLIHLLDVLNNSKTRFLGGGTPAWITTMGTMLPGVASKIEALRNGVIKVQSAMGLIGSRLRPVINVLSSIKDRLISLIPHFKKVKDSSNDFGSVISNSTEKGIKRLGKMALAVIGVRSAFMGIRKAINLALESNEKAQATINTMWKGIANLIQPIINTVVNGIAKIMSYVNSLYKVFTGKDLFSSVKSATDSASDSAKDLAENAKEAKKQLAGFDEMQVLNSNDSSSSNTSSGSSNPDTSFIADTFDVEAIKAKLEELFEPLKNAWDKYGKGFTDAFKTALGSIWELIKSIGSSFKEVWTNGTGELTCSLILQILTNVFNIIGTLASKFKEAWDEAGLGTSIIQDLWDIFNDVLKIIESITSGLLTIAKKIDFTPLLKGIKNVTSLFKDLFDIAVEFWKVAIDSLSKGDFSGVGKAFSDAFTSTIDRITKYIKSIDWLQVGKDVAKNISNGIGKLMDFISGIDWKGIANSIINFLGTAIVSVAQLLYGFFSTLFSEGLKAITSINWGEVASTIINGLINALAGLGNALLTLFKNAFSGVFSWAEEVGKNVWESIKKGFSNIGETLILTISAIKDGAFDLVKQAWDSIKNSKVVKTMSAVKEAVFDTLKSTWDSIKNGTFTKTLKGLVDSALTNAKKTWDAIKNSTFTKTLKGAINSTLTSAKKVWDAIKNGTFTKTLKGVVNSALTKAKNVWDSLKSKTLSLGMKLSAEVANMKSFVNSIINAINKNVIAKMYIKIPDSIPFIGGKKIGPPPNIPTLARGGIVNVPTQFIAGEAGQEAVLPLQNHTEWMDRLADKLAERVSTNKDGSTTIILQVGDQELYRWIINMQKKNQMMLNGG